MTQPRTGVRRPAQTRRAAGFTLIEVLVALAIVTVGMAALLSSLSSSADTAAYLRDKTLAEWVALNRIEEVRLALQRPAEGKSDGTAEMAGRQWKWAQEVLKTEVKGILRVDVSARPADAPGGDKGYYTTLSAIVGDAVAPPRGDMDPYGTAPTGGGNPSGQKDGQTNGQNGSTNRDSNGSNNSNNGGNPEGGRTPTPSPRTTLPTD